MNDINFECTACGNCCQDLRLALTITEAIAWLERGGQMELICEAIPWPVEPEPGNAQAAYKRARSVPAMSGSLPVRISIVLAAAFDGACPNLRADMRCGIYEHRPLVCRIYPAEINPFVELTPQNKACPPEAWQNTPLQRQGILVDATTMELIEQSRRANQLEAPQRMQLCFALGLNQAALANEGFVMDSPDSDALLTALRRLHGNASAHADLQEAAAQWTLVSNRTASVETLRSVGAAAQLAETETMARNHSRYHGFFPPS